MATSEAALLARPARASERATRGRRLAPVWWQTGRRTPVWWAVCLGGPTLLAYVIDVEARLDVLPRPDLVLASAGQVAEFTVGLAFWMWRPRNPVGPLLAFWPLLSVATDLPYDFPGSQLAWTVFLSTAGLYGAVYVNAILLFPSGRLRSRSLLLVIASVYATLWAHRLPILLFDGWPGAPPFLHSLLYAGHTWSGMGTWLNVWAVAGIVTIVVADCLLVVRVRRAPPGARRRLLPLIAVFVVLWTFVFVYTSLFTLGVVKSTEWSLYVYSSVYGLSAVAAAVGLTLVRRRRGDVADLVVELDRVRSGSVRERLAQVLGDPSALVALWSTDRDTWVDELGHDVAIAVGGSRAVTHVGDGRAVVIHDRDLLDQPRLVEAAGSAALLALENDRLQEELRRQAAEVRASRARLVEGDDRERRRLQSALRNRVQLELGELQAGLASLAGRLDETGHSLLEEVRAELAVARAELDELAHGIHPTLLGEAGLAGALQTLAARTPVPVDVRPCRQRLPDPVETATYFLVAEALANIARFSGATKASVEVRNDQGLARIEIRDDGIGGADPGSGSGLRGLSDRVAALGGRLRISSPPGGGTTVLAEIPCSA